MSNEIDKPIVTINSAPAVPKKKFKKIGWVVLGVVILIVVIIIAIIAAFKKLPFIKKDKNASIGIFDDLMPKLSSKSSSGMGSITKLVTGIGPGQDIAAKATLPFVSDLLSGGKKKSKRKKVKTFIPGLSI